MKRALDERFGVYANRLSQNGQNLEGKDGGWRARFPVREGLRSDSPAGRASQKHQSSRHGTLGINRAKDTAIHGLLGVVVGGGANCYLNSITTVCVAMQPFFRTGRLDDWTTDD